MNIRRIVTAQTPAGAVVVSDEPVPAVTVGLLPGAEFHALWGSDAVASLPFNEQAPKAEGWFPPAGGFRFHTVTLGPDSGAPPAGVDLDAGIAEISQKLPGIVEAADPDNPGMHISETVDFVVVLRGEAWLDLGNGEKTLVKAGDTVVQNGTRHAWRNTTGQPCILAVTLIGATRAARSAAEPARSSNLMPRS